MRGVGVCRGKGEGAIGYSPIRMSLLESTSGGRPDWERARHRAELEHGGAAAAGAAPHAGATDAQEAAAGETTAAAEPAAEV